MKKIGFLMFLSGVIGIFIFLVPRALIAVFSSSPEPQNTYFLMVMTAGMIMGIGIDYFFNKKK